ncbi:MAG: PAC2 family protein [Desulfurococcales archaeon]|nr:PAC2 family protein [Desulfurococcales archaeon]
MLEVFKEGRNVKIYYDKSSIDPVKNPILITGFPGFGATGYITTRYLVEALKMKRIGFIMTRYMPDTVSIEGDTGFVFPHEIYSGLDGKVFVLVNQAVPMPVEKDEFAEAIVRWARKNSFNEMILVGGLDSEIRKSPDDMLRWIGNSHCRRKIEEPVMEKGLVIVGPLATLLMYSEIIGLPALAILPYAERNRPDPRAAAVAVSKIAKILNTEIDVSELIKHAETIEVLEKKIKSELETTETRISQKYYM